MNLVCPACGTANRIPDERLHDGPVCGSCGTALMAAEPVPLSDAALPKFIASTGLPVLADFWAAWCGPCKAMAPTFASVARQMPEVRFVKIDSDAAPAATDDPWQPLACGELLAIRDGVLLAGPSTISAAGRADDAF